MTIKYGAQDVNEFIAVADAIEEAYPAVSVDGFEEVSLGGKRGSLREVERFTIAGACLGGQLSLHNLSHPISRKHPALSPWFLTLAA